MFMSLFPCFCRGLTMCSTSFWNCGIIEAIVEFCINQELHSRFMLDESFTAEAVQQQLKKCVLEVPQKVVSEQYNSFRVAIFAVTRCFHKSFQGLSPLEISQHKFLNPKKLTTFGSEAIFSRFGERKFHFFGFRFSLITWNHQKKVSTSNRKKRFSNPNRLRAHFPGTSPLWNSSSPRLTALS